MYVSSEAQNSKDTIGKTHETQEEGRPTCTHTLLILRRGDKMPMEGITETKCGTEKEVMTIQRLPHLGIYPTTKPRHY